MILKDLEAFKGSIFPPFWGWPVDFGLEPFPDNFGAILCHHRWLAYLKPFHAFNIPQTMRRRGRWFCFRTHPSCHPYIAAGSSTIHRYTDGLRFPSLVQTALMDWLCFLFLCGCCCSRRPHVYFGGIFTQALLYFLALLQTCRLFLTNLRKQITKDDLDRKSFVLVFQFISRERQLDETGKTCNPCHRSQEHVKILRDGND